MSRLFVQFVVKMLCHFMLVQETIVLIVYVVCMLIITLEIEQIYAMGY